MILAASERAVWRNTGVGAEVGAGVGEDVGVDVGVGAADGAADGAAVGATVGTADGAADGATVGTAVGALVGTAVGTWRARSIGDQISTPLHHHIPPPSELCRPLRFRRLQRRRQMS